MKKILVAVLTYMAIATSVAWAQDAMYFYKRGLESSLANRRVGYFTRAIELNPNSSMTYEAYSECLIVAGKYDEAIDDLQISLKTKKAEDDQSGTVATLRDIARIMEEKGDLDESLEYLKLVAKIDPLAWSEVGLLLSKMNLHKKSISAYKKFLKKAPENADALYNIGWAYEQRKYFSKALEYYDLAVKSNPDFALALSGKGTILHWLGKNEEAAKAFEESLAIEPRNLLVLKNLTAIYYDFFYDYKGALSYAQRALNIDPKDISAKSNLAEILLPANRYKEARDYAKQVLELDDATPNHRIAMYFVISTSYFLEGRVQEGNRNLEILTNYLKSLPKTFTINWGYEGISKVIAESNSIQENYKTKLLQTIRSLPHA